MSGKLRGYACLDACAPTVTPVRRASDDMPYVYLVISETLELLAHDPVVLRHLAAAAITAAEALETAIDGPLQVQAPADARNQRSFA